jgi:hypothetical protein
VPHKTRYFVAATVLGLMFLASCSQNSALSLAREACSHVQHSITAYEAGLHTSNALQRRHDLTVATSQLDEAEPLAAAATSANGRWNALMTTLSEFGQVSENHLIHALQAQCAVAHGNQSDPQSLTVVHWEHGPRVAS